MRMRIRVDLIRSMNVIIPGRGLGLFRVYILICARLREDKGVFDYRGCLWELKDEIKTKLPDINLFVWRSDS